MLASSCAICGKKKAEFIKNHKAIGTKYLFYFNEILTG